MYLQENTLFDLDLGVLVQQYNTIVTSAPAKFEVAMSIGLGGDEFTRKYIN